VKPFVLLGVFVLKTLCLLSTLKFEVFFNTKKAQRISQRATKNTMKYGSVCLINYNLAFRNPIKFTIFAKAVKKLAEQATAKVYHE